MAGNGKQFLRDRYLYEEAIMRHVCSKWGGDPYRDGISGSGKLDAFNYGYSSEWRFLKAIFPSPFQGEG